MNKNSFRCRQCNGTKLHYLQFVKSEVPVTINDDGTVSYANPIIHQDETVPYISGYFCSNCNTKLSYGCKDVGNDKELIEFIAIAPEEVKRVEEEHIAELEAFALEEQYKDDFNKMKFED